MSLKGSHRQQRDIGGLKVEDRGQGVARDGEVPLSTIVPAFSRKLAYTNPVHYQDSLYPDGESRMQW